MEATAAKPTFQKYPTYKDSGVEWLGEIPEHWEVYPGLRFVTENKSKNIGMKRNTVLSLSYGKIRVKQEDELTGLVPESFETYQLVNKGDLIFRPTDLQNDKVSLRSAYSEYNGIITNAYLNLKFKKSANSKFFHYFFRAIDNNKIIYGLGSGLRQNISYIDFRRFLFPFPPLPEQTAIAEFLDRKTEQIDRAIAQKEKMITLLKERKQIVIQELVTGKKVWNEQQNTWTAPAKVKDSGVEWIGEIPEGWEVKRLRNIGNTQNGISASGEYFGHGFPFVSYGDVYKNIELPKILNGLANSTVHDRKNYSVQKGDVFFTRTSETIQEIGFSSTCLETIDNATFAGFLIRFRPQIGILEPQFSKFYFSAQIHRSFFIREMNLVTRASLGQELLKQLPVLIPPFTEQKIIAQHIESQSAKIDKAIHLQEQQIEKLKELKAGVIDAAVTGKINVVS